jgi:hypothetical protein
MSEYQYYEFKSVDRALTEKERETISSWSSRTRASADGAVFTYHYSDFPRNEEEVVQKYFDAMFYTSNWGTSRLMFKIPTSVIDARAFAVYDSDSIIISQFKEYTLMELMVEEGGYDYYEPDSMLGSLMPLRNDLMNGDTRCMYLLWLNEMVLATGCEWADIDPDCQILKVPNGFNEMTPALQCLMETFEVDPDLLTVLQKYSGRLNEADDTELAKAVEDMAEEDKNDFLHRLLANEKNLSSRLKRHIQPSPSNSGRIAYENITMQQVYDQVQEIKYLRKQAERDKRNRQKLARLEKTAAQESMLWIQVDRHIAAKNSKGYEEAVKILVQLKELAAHKNKLDEYYERTQLIQKEHSRLSALKNRMNERKLLK